MSGSVIIETVPRDPLTVGVQLVVPSINRYGRPMTEQAESAGQVLRDYLYLDVDKVKSIAGQLDSGVPEEARLTRRGSKRTSIGWDKILSHAPESSEETYVHRSMLDSLFPELEELLEQGWLLDISKEFSQEPPDLIERLMESRPEGSLFRLTADGYLFDVRHLTKLFANFATAIAGYQEFEKATKDLAESMEKQATGAPAKKAPPRKQKDVLDEVLSSIRLEEAIEEFAPQPGISPALLRTMIHTARGVFSPGLHLIMGNSSVTGSFSVSARLQEGGRYLEASPDVISSRYGGKPQRWTIVGTVGHYSETPEVASSASLATEVENELSDDFNRQRFIRTMNNFVRDVAQSGMMDLPQHPGMSAIPIAVYRAVREAPPMSSAIPATTGP